MRTVTFQRRVPLRERPPFGSPFNRGWRFRLAAFCGAFLLYLLGCILLLLGGLLS